MERQTKVLARCSGAALVVLAAACRNGGEAEPHPVATASASAPPSAAASASARSTFAGSWTGSYDAQKAPVHVPEGVRYESWEEDDGKKHAGQGTIELSVDGEGQVSGQANGALGAQHVRGRMDDGMLNAGLSPSDERSTMSGTLVGRVSGDRIEAKLRVASGDGNVVRASEIVLTRR